jgi:hypothetical protein
MDAARRAQAKSSRSMKGKTGLTKEQRLAIAATAISYEIVPAPQHVELEIRILLLERFEEMCRRQCINVPAGKRHAILDALLAELRTNQEALNASAGKLA